MEEECIFVVASEGLYIEILCAITIAVVVGDKIKKRITLFRLFDCAMFREPEIMENGSRTRGLNPSSYTHHEQILHCSYYVIAWTALQHLYTKRSGTFTSFSIRGGPAIVH